MAKKKQQEVIEEPQIQQEVVEQPKTEESKTRERVKPSNEWEIKDRLYNLKMVKNLFLDL